MISYVVLRWFEGSQLEILSTVSLAEAVASLGSAGDVIRAVENGDPRPLTVEEGDRAEGISIRSISANFTAGNTQNGGGGNMNTKKVVDGREVQCFSSEFYFNRGWRGSINTNSLVIGQNVYMFSSGVYLDSGKVVGVNPSGAEVRTHQGVLVRFDANGKETDESRRDRLGFGPDPESKFHTALWNSAPEFQPWELDDMPFAERTALIEQQRRDWEAKKINR